jgi:hypothetical protein
MVNAIVKLSNILSMAFARGKNKANNNGHMVHENPFNNIESLATPIEATHVKTTFVEENNINNDM